MQRLRRFISYCRLWEVTGRHRLRVSAHEDLLRGGEGRRGDGAIDGVVRAGVEALDALSSVLRGLAAATVPIVPPPHPDSVGHSDEVEPSTPLNDLRVVLGLFVNVGLRVCFVPSLVLWFLRMRMSAFPAVPRSWSWPDKLNRSYL